MVLIAYGERVHGDQVAGAFVAHYKSFIVQAEKSYPIYQPAELFIRSIPTTKAELMTRTVINKEVKLAMFDIGDNRAPGPDGYTSAFLKASWDLVGNDICATVKEFFVSGK